VEIEAKQSLELNPGNTGKSLEGLKQKLTLQFMPSRRSLSFLGVGCDGLQMAMRWLVIDPY
jgi:hypothetical protein